MTGMAIFLALLLGASTPEAPSAEAAARDANNWDVILSQYPERARAAGEQGAVGFKVTLDRDGYASACEVTHSSGYPQLDDETCQLILNRAVFKGVRDGDGRKVSSVHEGVVNWKLPGSAPNATPAATTAAAEPKSEKMVCRRRVKTGTLAGYERVCATKSDWQRMGERTREEWGALQGTLGNTKGN